MAHPVSGLQSWFDPGQSRESGGRTAEKTDYEAAGITRWSRRGSEPTGASGGHVADGGTHGGGSTTG